MERTYETFIDCGELGEVEAIVKYDYQPKERATHDYPGCPAQVTVNDIILQGVVLSPKRLADLIRIYDVTEILEDEDERERNKGCDI